MSLADLTTKEIAAFQLIEQGFVGITEDLKLCNNCIAHLLGIHRQNGVTLIRAEDAKTGKPVAVLTVFKPGIEAGTFHVEPIARLLEDPSEVINPQFEHTDGAGNVIEDSGADDNSPAHSGSRGNKADT